jgi:hypothetical protein
MYVCHKIPQEDMFILGLQSTILRILKGRSHIFDMLVRRTRLMLHQTVFLTVITEPLEMDLAGQVEYDMDEQGAHLPPSRRRHLGT